MEKELVIALITGHFILDWILQPRWMAKRKSSELKILLVHLSIIFTGIFAITWIFSPFPVTGLLQLNLINVAAHGIIDWNIWKVAGGIMDKYPDGDRKEYAFYSTIAVDQTLHLVILMLLFV